MLDWKVLASAFIAMIIVTIIMLEGFGASSFLSGGMSFISEWFGSSPFGGLVSGGSDGKQVTVTLYQPNLTLRPQEEVEIETVTVNISGFVGDIHADFDSKILVLYESGSDLKVAFPLKNIRISGFKINKLQLENSNFMIEPNITTDNGTIEMKDFFGTVTTKTNGLEFQGNVSELSAKIGDLSWELS